MLGDQQRVRYVTKPNPDYSDRDFFFISNVIIVMNFVKWKNSSIRRAGLGIKHCCLD